MYKKLGVDITVYDKSAQMTAHVIMTVLIVFSILMAIILTGRIEVIGHEGIYLPILRGTGSIVIGLIYITVYIFSALQKDSAKLFLAATSAGVIIGSVSFILIILFKDLGGIQNYAMRYGESTTFAGRFSVFSNYFTICYMQFIPPLVALFLSNILRLCMRGKGLSKNEKNSGMYGTASFANDRYLKDNDFFNDENSIFGKSIKKQKLLKFPICNRTVISKPGGGKTTGITIPALLTENRPCFVHDPKGELWAVTARYRVEKYKRKVLTIDPFGVTEQQGFRDKNNPVYEKNLKRTFINPLAYVPEDIKYRDRFITSLVSSIVKADSSKHTSEASNHFNEQTQIIIGGMLELILDIRITPKYNEAINNILKKIDDQKTNITLRRAQQALNESNGISTVSFDKELLKLRSELTSELLEEIILKKPEEPPTLFEIYQLLNRDLLEITKDMKFIMKYGSIRAQQAASTLLTTGENERGSILSSTRRQLMWLVDFNLRETFTNNTDDLRGFIDGEVDIYIIMPEDQINQQSRCIRMLLSIIQSFLVQEEVNKLSQKKYLFLLDELGQLDYNPDIEQAISILRGRRCVFWSVFQTYSQIEQYKKPDLFIDTGMLQFFSVGDPKIMQLIQRLGGKQTKLIERSNNSSSKSRAFGSLVKGNTSESDGSSVYEIQSDLIHFNEIRELPKDEQYVFIDGLKPVHCKKIRYYDDPYFNGYDINPIEEVGTVQIKNQKKQVLRTEDEDSIIQTS